VRITLAVAFVCPPLTMPRSSSFSFRKVSASSRINVGFASSIIRKSAAGLIFVAANGRLAR